MRQAYRNLYLQKLSNKTIDTDQLRDLEIKLAIPTLIELREWAKLKKPKRVVFTSSMSVYGKIANNAKENENCNFIMYGPGVEKIFEESHSLTYLFFFQIFCT